jgi:hypothetical protein
VVGIGGGMRQGKTYVLTVFATMYKQAGLQIAANYDYRFADIRLENIPQLPTLWGPGFIAWDEIHQTLNARKAMSDIAIEVSSWMLLMGKQGPIVDGGWRLFWTAHSWWMVDPNVRRVTDYFLDCHYTELRGLPATRIDFWHIMMGGEAAQYMYSRTILHSHDVYAIYDTKDMRVRLSRFPDGKAEIPIASSELFQQKQTGKRSRVPFPSGELTGELKQPAPSLPPPGQVVALSPSQSLFAPGVPTGGVPPDDIVSPVVGDGQRRRSAL